MSTIVITLILILVSLVAVGIVWLVVRNLTQDLITTPSTIVVYGGSYPMESLNLTSLQAQNVNGSILFSLTSGATVGFFESMRQKYGNWLYYSIMIIVSMMLILLVVVITKKDKLRRKTLK